MARNRYSGYCYVCGNYVPIGFGFFERYKGRWRIKCVKCTDGRIVKNTDKEVLKALKLNKKGEY